MRIKFGSIVVDGRNKLGGHVYSKNRGGNYVRTNIIPTNPNTPAQQQARGRFALASSGWKALTEEQRKQWSDFAGDNKYSDLFGDSRTLSANAAFVRSTVNILTSGITTNAGPVNVDENVYIEDVKIRALSTLTDVVIDFGTFDGTKMGNGKMVVHITPPFPASQKYATNRFRVLGSYDSTDVTNHIMNIGSDYEAMFGGIQQGERIAVKVMFVKSNGLSTLLGGSDDVVGP